MSTASCLSEVGGLQTLKHSDDVKTDQHHSKTSFSCESPKISGRENIYVSVKLKHSDDVKTDQHHSKTSFSCESTKISGRENICVPNIDGVRRPNNIIKFPLGGRGANLTSKL